ncbi:hypothetical protein GGH99_004748, partial [Coemansia sp. RSA 1285]
RVVCCQKGACCGGRRTTPLEGSSRWVVGCQPRRGVGTASGPRRRKHCDDDAAVHGGRAGAQGGSGCGSSSQPGVHRIRLPAPHLRQAHELAEL